MAAPIDGHPGAPFLVRPLVVGRVGSGQPPDYTGPGRLSMTEALTTRASSGQALYLSYYLEGQDHETDLLRHWSLLAAAEEFLHQRSHHHQCLHILEGLSSEEES